MNGEDVIDSNEYKVSKAALEWYSNNQDADVLDGFEAGAKWQKTTDIVDFYYHLKMRLPDTLDYNGVKVDSEDFVNDLKQSIER